MKCLSIRQPWAWAILNCGKDIENRDWHTNFRGKFLIHASKRIDKYGIDFLEANGFQIPEFLPTGGIIGMSKIIGCVTSNPSKWFFGKYGFVLRDSTPLEFIPAKGQLGFFEAIHPGAELFSSK